MPFFSRRAGRLSGALAAALGLAALAASPAAAATKKPPKVGKKMVGANSVESVIRYLKSKGDEVTQDVSDLGHPMLIEANNYYEVYFNCDDQHANCDAIQFRACYDGYPEADFEKANAVNRDFFMVEGYINNDGYACFEMPVVTGLKGISYEAADVGFDVFVAFTETADETYGPPAEGMGQPDAEEIIESES